MPCFVSSDDLNPNFHAKLRKKCPALAESPQKQSIFVSMLIRSGALTILSVLVIILSSPLFAVLGFEYSTIMALALSLVCGIVAARSRGTEWPHVRMVLFECLILASVPLVVSVISLILLN